MNANWENSTCEICTFQKSGECRKNPPCIAYTPMEKYPTVRINGILGDVKFRQACSQYIENK